MTTEVENIVNLEEDKQNFVEEPLIDTSTKKPEKNPNRVKAGLKLAAIGQKAKEEKMRKKVKEEMIQPKTWILAGAVITSVGFLGLYFCPLFREKAEEKYVPPPVSEKKKEPKNYFG